MWDYARCAYLGNKAADEEKMTEKIMKKIEKRTGERTHIKNMEKDL